MAVAQLLAAVEAPEYSGKPDTEIVAALNEVKRAYTAVDVRVIDGVLQKHMVHGTVAVHREKGRLSDNLFIRWTTFLNLVEAGAVVFLNEQPLNLIGLFEELDAAGAMPDQPSLPPCLQAIRNLGEQTSTVGRSVFQRDVTEDDLVKVREFVGLRDKIDAQAAAVKAEHDARMAEISAAYEEMQKRDSSLQIIGDKDFVPEWEKAR